MKKMFLSQPAKMVDLTISIIELILPFYWLIFIILIVDLTINLT